jgi:hypothetical protein
VRALTGGLVPVVIVNAAPVHRMMSTVRHNRARGTHAVLRMAEIVRSMAESGLGSGEICTRLGMEEEELERLLDRSGMTVRGTAGINGFGRAWVPGREGWYGNCHTARVRAPRRREPDGRSEGGEVRPDSGAHR